MILHLAPVEIEPLLVVDRKPVGPHRRKTLRELLLHGVR